MSDSTRDEATEIIRVLPGTAIRTAIKDALNESRRAGKPVRFGFNGIAMIVRADDLEDELLIAWEEAMGLAEIRERASRNDAEIEALAERIYVASVADPHAVEITESASGLSDWPFQWAERFLRSRDAWRERRAAE